MNIVMISPAIYPCVTGGVEIFNYYLIKELAKRGHKVWIFTNCEHDWNDKNISAVKLSKRFLLKPTLSIDSHILFKLIKLRKRVDVVHVPYTSNSHLAYPMLLAKKLFDIHYIIVIHGGGMYPWKQKTLHKLFFQHADAIVAVSETIKEEYEKRSGRKIRVLPNLIPFNHSKETKIDLKKKYDLENSLDILYLGTIKKIKGVDTLINAFMCLGLEYIKNNNIKLVICGMGSLKNSLEKKVGLSGFSEHIKFWGFVDDKTKLEAFKMSDIYVIPSHFEAQSISLLEAMSNGLPIIGTDTTGISNMIKEGDNGLLFPVGEHFILKNKLKLIIEDDDLRLNLAIRSEKYYNENFNYDEWLKKMEVIYLSIYDKNRGYTRKMLKRVI